MGDASLSQDEINALLQEADDLEKTDSSAAPSQAKKSDGSDTAQVSDLQTANKIITAIAKAQAAALSSIVMGEPSASLDSGSVKPLDQAAADMKGEVLVVKLAYDSPSSGNVFYLMKAEDAKELANVTMGSKPEKLDDDALASLKDPFNQMANGSDSQVSSDFGFTIHNTGPKLTAGNAPDNLTIPAGSYYTANCAVKLSDEVTVNMLKLYPVPFINSLIAAQNKGGDSSLKDMDELLSDGGGNETASNIQNANFSNLTETAEPSATGNINLLLDVQMEVTVELGRATKTVKDVLSLGEGSIIELDKLAGEPVDLLVNQKRIAKGEVVVIDENFGVRVTEIVHPKARLGNNEEEQTK
ncbi:MAG TPA: flagellar motor switch protein FliN [Spirochaetota bacterium]|nr:flagellar motor switch protein FliN [Spirochaetota bacterium]